jgi:alkylation response protein AidB-like acyl-CoA dehydrogenase
MDLRYTEAENAFKLAYTEARQTWGEFSMRLLDRAGLSLSEVGGVDGHGALSNEVFAEDWLRDTACSILAGTSQIQRNILSERMLGLPR